MAHRSFFALVLTATVLGLVAAAGPAVAQGDEDRLAATPRVVAVVPFSSPTSWSQLGRNAQDTFVTTLVKARGLRVVQADMVQRMLRRRGLRYTGVIDTELLKAAGRWLKADFLLAGKLRYTGDAFTLSAHVMDVRTLQTVFAEDLDFRDTSRMRVAVRLLAKRMAAQLSGESDGASGSSSGKAELFLNVDARAFYDTAQACIDVLRSLLTRHRFTGSIAAVDEQARTLRAEGSGGQRLRPGLPLDVYDTSGVDGETHVVTAYVVSTRGNTVEARYVSEPSNGIPLDGRVTTDGHRWSVAVGQIEDEVEENEPLVDRLRTALVERLEQDESTTAAQVGVTSATGRPNLGALWRRGVELWLEGKLYGTVGGRRAHFKVYTTATGLLLSELKFETAL